jgi:hypothetical protein
MKRLGWQVKLGVGLLFASAVVYLIHYLVFRDVHFIFIYLLLSLAFLPIEVLVVTLIIQEFLRQRERRVRLEKLNMVIGAFFSVMGTRLLSYLSDYDPNLPAIRGDLVVRENWTDSDFADLSSRLKRYQYRIDVGRIDLKNLKEILARDFDFMVGLLENPNLLEHESFTSLLRAVFHLAEELESTRSFDVLPVDDISHLGEDTERAYGLLVGEWVDYMYYLKSNYPYLFSLAMRTNPFDEEAAAIALK